ncbi:uncharacterized protein BO88DRAFT_270236 [Aspergillus vadensis CBS 113365]|uniref:Uncharacterized protein n=1 Tax=Aspergillus vadensis (strain CBS 113365 / IMI 142717 / IBT 24658) TaxID=1448311 RepID=A0A319BAD1_ASPVC|nr:hypothetical protein BO88DRAFT_270236 [Aspergillus vadensis CBS 113365]PYH69906.1 hypothetical protein BO88DRAFT_270236 [Aspergillus vadensis CBS 113365]
MGGGERGNQGGKKGDKRMNKGDGYIGGGSTENPDRDKEKKEEEEEKNQGNQEEKRRKRGGLKSRIEGRNKQGWSGGDSDSCARELIPESIKSVHSALSSSSSEREKTSLISTQRTSHFIRNTSAS